MGELGLHEWGVRHGLATKLMLRPQEELDELGYTEGPPELGAERFDVERSLTLYDEVYRYRGLLGRDIWPDRRATTFPPNSTYWRSSSPTR